MDLAGTTVLFDFDGTVALRDVGRVLLEELGSAEWRVVDELHRRGELSRREAVTAWFEMLPADRDRLLDVARTVPLDPAFGPLVGSLRAGGAQVKVVSDSFGFYVTDRLAGLDVDVITNEVDWSGPALRFPHEDRCCSCTSCGTCKQAPVRDAAQGAGTAVFVGSTLADRKAVLLADVVFASGELESWCRAFDVDHVSFRDLSDVARVLVP